MPAHHYNPLHATNTLWRQHLQWNINKAILPICAALPLLNNASANRKYLQEVSCEDENVPSDSPNYWSNALNNKFISKTASQHTPETHHWSTPQKMLKKSCVFTKFFHSFFWLKNTLIIYNLFKIYFLKKIFLIWC